MWEARYAVNTTKEDLKWEKNIKKALNLLTKVHCMRHQKLLNLL
ncbi:hypothetical protein CLOSBL3_20027 [Clostridiaceae bacterium BL-3]|nr:hypothetical protein CLOSBL3_20027 [Clostridiaceae bacterium BL-3]